MNDMPSPESSFEAKVLSYLAVHTSKLEDVTHDIREIKDELRRTNQTSFNQGEKIHNVEIEMAKRENICPVILKTEQQLIRRIASVERSVGTLKTGVAMVKGGYKAVAGIATMVFLLLTAAYHILGISKVIAAILPKGN